MLMNAGDKQPARFPKKTGSQNPINRPAAEYTSDVRRVQQIVLMMVANRRLANLQQTYNQSHRDKS